MLTLLGCAAEESPFYAPDGAGPYTASAQTLTWTDARGVAMTAELWTPTTAACEAEPYPELPITGSACREQVLADGEFPLVAFSHGNAGIRYQSIFLTEMLAAHGYVVIAPDHPKNTLLDFEDNALADVAAARPADVSSAVDEAERLGFGDGTFAMIGHSFGGWTSLVVGGGVYDADVFAAACADDPAYDLCGIGFADDVAPPDARAMLTIPMAAPGWYSFSDLSEVGQPLVFGGALDEGASPEREIAPTFERLGSPKAMAILEGAGHYAFTDICLIGDLQPDCFEDGFVDLETAHAEITVRVLAWLGLHGRGDARFEAYLVGEDGVEWTDG